MLQKEGSRAGEIGLPPGRAAVLGVWLVGRGGAHSLRKASTGSFRAATREGISPATMVSTALMATRIAAPATGRAARRPSMPVSRSSSETARAAFGEFLFQRRLSQ